MARVLINKHYDNQQQVTLNSFTSDEIQRKGEVIIVNDAENPGIFIVDTLGQVINVASQVNIEGIEEILERLISKYMKREVLTREEYQYKVDNNLIDDECMYYVYDGDYSGDTGFIPHVIEGTEILEVDETANTETETIEIVGGSYDSESEVFTLPEYTPAPTPSPDGSDTEIVPSAGGNGNYVVTTSNTPDENEVLELDLTVDGEVATI